MRDDHHCSSGLDLFWEQADAEGCAEHPLERELAHRADALFRYARLLDEACAVGDDDAVESLTQLHRRELHAVMQLEQALRRRDDDARASARTTDARSG